MPKPLFVSDYPLTYFGIEPSAYEAADAVIIPVPYEGTVSFGRGASLGPRAMRIASRQVESYLPDRNCDLFDKIAIHSLDDLEPNADGPRGMIDRVRDSVELVNQSGQLPIIIGGEHSISLGAVEALVKKYPDLTVLQIDAHCDLRDSYQGSKFSHACVMRRIREIIPAIQVGIRNMSASGHAYLKTHNLTETVFGPAELNIENIVSLCRSPLYITFDLDGLDPSIMPAVGTPEPGGLTWSSAVKLLESVFQKVKVVGFDIVELAPRPDNSNSDFIAAKLLFKMIEFYQANSQHRP